MSNITTIKLNADTSWKITNVFCLSALALMLPEMAMATTTVADDVIGNTLCNVVEALQGRVGKGIATIAVVFLGIGLFLGKLSWGLAVAIGLGIGGIFGSSKIVEWMAGDNAGSASCDS